MNATATTVYETIQRTANEKRTDAPKTVGSLARLDYTRQGDVYFWSIEKVPAGAIRESKPSGQLAPGTTQGSRHCVADPSAVTMYRLESPNALQGPIIDAPNGVTITHPEHGHQTLGPGVYAVTYQRAYAEELRRVQD